MAVTGFKSTRRPIKHMDRSGKMAYSLSRTRDKAGDSGNMSTALWKDPVSGELETEHNAVPRVGVVMRVGSSYARSYSGQDYWQTTFINEILEEITDPENPGFLYIRFKTGNSEYEWTRF
jgi:hypothetical protein